MNGRNGIIFEVKRGLRQCGYSGALLRENHIYGDERGEHTIQLAGFARPVYDSRTSCIAVIICESPEQAIEGRVCEYRDFGAPVALVCCNGTMQWWAIGAGGADYRETVSKETVRDFFDKHEGDFGPDRISRAKNLGRVAKDQQLAFVDIGLMPLLEEEMGERVGDLMNRVLRLLQEGFTAGQRKEAGNQRWIFRAGFWILCAKILKDKGVKNFAELRIDDIDAVLETVRTHYGAQQDAQIATNRQRNAIEEAAKQIDVFASLSNLTTEAFGYMYENVLVDKKLRAALGIHATPSYLVDYIVWQLWPWIKEIPEEKRVVLEAACGHAPFLTGAMRLLRELFEGDGKAFHRYAKRNLIGIETDSFAREIAKLSLTMADIPNPNGWKIVEGDIYRGDVLSKRAKMATVLLCNPPFENFSRDQQNAYRADGQELRCFNKAAEVLWRTLPNMSEGSVFGVVLPQGFLHKSNLSELRETILVGFEVSQICTLPENVFRFGKNKSVLLFGRKRVRGGRKNKVLYREVSKEGLNKFRKNYEGRDQDVWQSRFRDRKDQDLRVIELDDVWEYCRESQTVLGSVVEGGQGFSFKGKGRPDGIKTFEREHFAGSVEGYVSFDSPCQLHELPDPYWVNLDREVIQRPRWGLTTGKPQIIMNHGRVGGGPWRVIALIDNEGWGVASAFLVFRIVEETWSLLSLWGILNSPFANAYMYCNSMERNNSSGTVKGMPIPFCTKGTLEKIEGLVGEYFTLSTKKESILEADIQGARKRLLLWIDAEVMRLYDLPPKMEKRVLDLFQGVQRKGVDFEFKGYYPEGFESAIPLHEYLSEEYQRSTVTFVDEWVEKHRSSEISRVLRQAVEAFEEE